MRFDDRVTGNTKTYSLDSKKIHIEIDPSEINKNVPVDVALVGDLKLVLNKLIPILNDQQIPIGLMKLKNGKKSHNLEIL